MGAAGQILMNSYCTKNYARVRVSSPGGRGQACLLSLYAWHGGTQANRKLRKKKVSAARPAGPPFVGPRSRPRSGSFFYCYFPICLGAAMPGIEGEQACLPPPAGLLYVFFFRREFFLMYVFFHHTPTQISRLRRRCNV